MPAIKLIYFNSQGRAELTRLILAQAGVDYEDMRINKEDWAELKKTIPFGQLPALQFDGVYITQSIAIARFVAREYNLAGKNNVETALADMYVDCLTDILNKVVPFMFEADPVKKAAGLKNFACELYPPFLANMETALKKNGGKYLVGSGVTYADIALAHALNSLGARIGEEWKTKSPVMAAYADSIHQLPNIKKWVETRPKE